VYYVVNAAPGRAETGAENERERRVFPKKDSTTSRTSKMKGVRLCCHARKNRETAKSRKNALIFVRVFAIL